MDKLNEAEAVKKLPKWAQQLIDRLTQTIRDRDERLATLTGEESSRVTHGRDFMGKAVNIPERDPVYFSLKGTGCRLEVRYQDDHIEVIGDRRIVVNPIAGNVVEITERDED